MDAFLLLAVKAAATGSLMSDGGHRPFDTGIGLPLQVPQNMRPLSSEEIQALNPAAHRSIYGGGAASEVMSGSRPMTSKLLSLLKSKGGRLGMAGTGLGLSAGIGLGLYGRNKAPEIPMEAPVAPQEPVPQPHVNVARESVRRTIGNKTKDALGNFWHRMQQQYGRQGIPQ